MLGKYVKTREGFIGRCIDVDDNYVYSDSVLSIDTNGIENSFEERSNIVKQSINIEDLKED